MRGREILWREFIQFYYITVMILFAYVLMYMEEMDMHPVLLFNLHGFIGIKILVMLAFIVAHLVIPHFLYKKNMLFNVFILGVKFIFIAFFWRLIETYLLYINWMPGKLVDNVHDGIFGILERVIFVIRGYPMGGSDPFAMVYRMPDNSYHIHVMTWFIMIVSVIIIVYYLARLKWSVYSNTKLYTMKKLLLIVLSSVTFLTLTIIVSIIIDNIYDLPLSYLMSLIVRKWFDPQNTHQYAQFFLLPDLEMLFVSIVYFLPMGIIIRHIFKRLVKLEVKSKP